MRALAHLGLAALVSPCSSVSVDDNTNLFQRIRRDNREALDLSDYATSNLMQETKFPVIEGLLYSMAEKEQTSVLATSLETMYDRSFNVVELPLRVKCDVNVDVVNCTDLCGFEIAFGIPKETQERLKGPVADLITKMATQKLVKNKLADAIATSFSSKPALLQTDADEKEDPKPGTWYKVDGDQPMLEFKAPKGMALGGVSVKPIETKVVRTGGGPITVEMSGDWGKKGDKTAAWIASRIPPKGARPYPVATGNWVRVSGKWVKRGNVTKPTRKADWEKVNYLPDWYKEALANRKKLNPDDIPKWWIKPLTSYPWDPKPPIMRHDQQKEFVSKNLKYHVPANYEDPVEGWPPKVFKGPESNGTIKHEADLYDVEVREKLYYDSLKKELAEPWWKYLEIHPEMPENGIDAQMRIPGPWCQIRTIVDAGNFASCDSKTRIPDGVDGALEAAKKLCERFGFKKVFAKEFDKPYGCAGKEGERPFQRVESVLQGDYTYLQKRGFMMIGPEYDMEEAIESGRNHYCNARRVLSEIEVPSTVANCGWMGKQILTNLSSLNARNWNGYTPCHQRDQKFRDCYKWAKKENCSVAKSLLDTVWPEKPAFYQYKTCPIFRTRDGMFSVWAATNWRTLIWVSEGFCMEGSRVRVGKSDCCKALPFFTNQCILTQQYCKQRDYMDYCSSYVCIDVKGTTKTVLQEHAQHLVAAGEAGYLHCGPCGQCSSLPDIQLWARHRHEMTDKLHVFIESHRKVEWAADARFEFISLFREMTSRNMGKVFTAGCVEAFLNTSMCEARLCPDGCTGSIAEPLSSYSTTDWEGKGNVCEACKARCSTYLKTVGGWDRRMLGIHGWDSVEDQKQVCQYGIFTDKNPTNIEVMSLR